MLRGKSINLRVLEKEDLRSPISEWNNKSDFYGEFAPLTQDSQAELEKSFEITEKKKWFVIEKKGWKQDWLHRLFSQR